MTMRSYDDIEFRPWYLPDTARWLKLSLGARGLAAELLRKLDRHGRIALGEDPASDLAVILRLDEADARKALTELLAAGRLVWDPVERLLSDPDLPARMRMGSAARMAKSRAKAEAAKAATAQPANDDDATPPVSASHPSQSVTDVTTRHHAHNPSPSDLICSDLISDLPRSEEPTGTPAREGVADALAPPPGWWDGVCRTVSAGCLGSETALSAGECWLAYAGHRNGKGRKPDRNDAVQWLTQVMVPKAKEAIRQAARDRERDAKYDASRARPPGSVEPLTVTPAQAERDAAALAARIVARKAKGAA